MAKPFGKQVLAPHLLFLHRLENLDDAFLVVDNVNTFKDFTVLPSAHLPDYLIVVLIPAKG